MPAVTMPLKQPNPQTILSATLSETRSEAQNATLSEALSETLHELCGYLAASPAAKSKEGPLSEEECAALAVAAIGGHPEAEFLVGSLFDAAGNPARAMEWYRRSASRDYRPAMLQLFAVR